MSNISIESHTVRRRKDAAGEPMPFAPNKTGGGAFLCFITLVLNIGGFKTKFKTIKARVTSTSNGSKPRIEFGENMRMRKLEGLKDSDKFPHGAYVPDLDEKGNVQYDPEAWTADGPSREVLTALVFALPEVRADYFAFLAHVKEQRVSSELPAESISDEATDSYESLLAEAQAALA